MVVRIAPFLLAVCTGFIFAAVPPIPVWAEASLKGRIPEISLRWMIGQMVLVGFVGSSPEAEGYRSVFRQAKEGKITGVIYLGRNIRGQKGVRLMNDGLQEAATFPLLIAVDQEGGRIERLTSAVGFDEVRSAAAVAKSMDPEAASRLYENLASGLSDLGFNLNLAPVVDVNVNVANPIIGKLGRSFSADPQKVTTYARAFVHGHRAKGVLTSLKHFPGHGSSTKDTHKEVADVTKTWSEEELLPYQALIRTGDVDMIMSSHVINDGLSHSKRVPSSLSPAILTRLLRETLRFNGVVISDDMQMGAISDDIGFNEAVREAVLAGNDILIFANDKHPDPLIAEKVAAVLFNEARKNPVMLERIREAYGNVIRLKRKLVTSGHSMRVDARETVAR